MLTGKLEGEGGGGSFTDEEGQVIGDTQISRVVGQPVVHHRVRHPVEGENEELLPDVRICDQVHGRRGRRRRPVLALHVDVAVVGVPTVTRHPLPL